MTKPPTNLIRIGGILTALVVSLLLASCGGESSEEPAPNPQPQDPPAVGEVETVTEDLEAPWSITFYEGTPLVSERDSTRILELDEGGEKREVATIGGVAPSGEGGLLGITVRDDYLYAYFTASGENRIERFEITGDAGSLGLGQPEMILDEIPASSIHNGGRVAFGPDGMLYATVGDAGNSDNAQDLDSPSGKILRMTPDGRVPKDNPFDGSLVYSLGHRNPQGIAWDGDTLYSSEFGQDTWDELNVIEAGGNYGWPEVEGMADQDEYVDPVQQWAPEEASPSGMTISGDSIYIANLRGERLREVPLNDLSSSTERFTDEYGRLRDAVVTPEGSLWVLTNNTDGRGVPTTGDDRIISVPAE